MKESDLKKILILDTIIESSQDTFYFKDIKSKIILSSKTHAALWGVDDPQKVIGKTDFDYFPESFAQMAYNLEQEIIVTGKPVTGIVERLTKPDETILWLSSSKYPFYNEEGELVGTWGMSRDITALKMVEQELIDLNKQLEEANRKLKLLSIKDSLSGLYNHRHFFEEIEKSFDLYTRKNEAALKKSFSVVLFDIDNFKHINDTYGHLMGDNVIRGIAEIITKNTRSSDNCFRYGGDEFAILLLDTTIEQARVVAEKIRQIIEKTPITIGDITIDMTVSMGVASFNEEEQVSKIVNEADENLYLSKKQGKNRVN